MQENNEPTSSQQTPDQPPKLVLSASDEQKLVRYVDLLAKIDQRRKKELEKDATTTVNI